MRELRVHPLRLARIQQDLTQEELAEATKLGLSTIRRAEQGFPINAKSRRLLCAYFGKTSQELGLFERGWKQPVGTHEDQTELRFVDKQPGNDQFLKENVANNTLIKETSHLSFLDLGVADKLESVESIINLAWEAWFASRPREAARPVNKLLPTLEQLAYSSTLPALYTLQAKHLVIRAHGLLGNICLDAAQNDPALFHYMQAHRFAEEIPDIDLTTTYLCLIGDALRRQNDKVGALHHMEQARDRASHASNATRGHVLQILAYTYGDTGQEQAFEHAISQATDLLAFAGEGIDIVQKEFIPFEVFEIRGKINRDLGKPLHALPYLELAEKSLHTSGSVTPRWHALLEIGRAQTYCDAGDIASGIDLACKGFIMAYQCRSLYQMNRVRKLLRKLEKGPFRNHPRIQDLKNLLYETYISLDSMFLL